LFDSTALKHHGHDAPSSFQKSASMNKKYSANLNDCKSYSDVFKVLTALVGKSLKRCQEPGGRSVESGYFPASRHLLVVRTTVVEACQRA
jgi:hypothetical protein